VGPHKGILRVFQDEGGLFDDVPFKRKKIIVNETVIPAFVRMIRDNVTNSVYVVVPIVGGKDFKAILPS
jgi:hypothetical protein